MKFRSQKLNLGNTNFLLSKISVLFLILFSFSNCFAEDTLDFKTLKSVSCVACKATYKTAGDYVALSTARSFVLQLKNALSGSKIGVDQSDDLLKGLAILDLYSANE